MDRFIREAECREITGLSRVTRWRLIKDGKFPPSRLISVNCKGWLLSEIERWVETRTIGSDGTQSEAATEPEAAV